MSDPNDFPLAPGQEPPEPKEKTEKVVPISAGRPRRAGPASKKEKVERAGAIVDRFQHKSVAALSGFAPIPSAYWALAAEDNTEAVLSIAEHRPKVLEGILALGELDAMITLGSFIFGLIIAVGVQAGFADPYGVAASGTGVTEAYEKVTAEKERIARERGEYYETGAAGNGQGQVLPGLGGELIS